MRWNIFGMMKKQNSETQKINLKEYFIYKKWMVQMQLNIY